MNKLNAVALANTFAIIDIVLHPLFHLWVSVNPESYEKIMNLFVAGLHLQVSEFDSSLEHIILGTIVEATVFWILAFVGASLYNRMSR
ncbi:MAG: hypothetical protein A2751_00375 [Candidatus Doudnabacteria bacterium RIFCSPHIGHO2_01_FULL_46_14]|uniref:Uncharacterized protein n=1 Tax=Candidatus Doudnabacteria bacterium RIFCSPHIGHO2_01_FULL_46_14 TaxID=1817824 RepID=A0A1F5NPD1_9BACT|nr:MAG: hypothetical protein A2751_00375 [Candidatus Doudnabacteria bacterium RIFCSPHIGHO2_01_FULL_46_14]